MGFSPLANMSRRIPHGGRQSKRNSEITGFTIHHNAGVNAYGQATNPSREVSAHYWITNEGEILPQIDENMRAYTTGSSGYPAGAKSDHRNITAEVSNSPEGVAKRTWAISEPAEAALERLIADVFKRHRLGPVRRGKSKGVAVHQDYVPTECPGPYIMLKLPSIIARAEQIRTSGQTTQTPKEEPELSEEMVRKVIREELIDAQVTAYGKQKSIRQHELDDIVLGHARSAALAEMRSQINDMASALGVEIRKSSASTVTAIESLLDEAIHEAMAEHFPSMEKAEADDIANTIFDRLVTQLNKE